MAVQINPTYFPAGATASTLSSPTAPATAYAGEAELAAAIAAIAGASLITLGALTNEGPQRADIFPAGNGTSGQTVDVDVYAVYPAAGGQRELEKLCRATGTLGTDAVAAGYGAPTSSVWSRTGTVTATNATKARLGYSVQDGFGGGGASTETGNRWGVSIPDLLNASHLVIVPARGSSGPATNASCAVRVWH